MAAIPTSHNCPAAGNALCQSAYRPHIPHRSTLQRFIMPLWFSRCLALLTVSAFVAGRATALDANRALTQAVHRIWQVNQGLPEATIHRVRQTSDGYLWL